MSALAAASQDVLALEHVILRMRHEAEHASGRIGDTGDVAGGAVRVGRIATLGRCAIVEVAEGDAVAAEARFKSLANALKAEARVIVRR